jgi:hypothetical protein
LITEEPFLKKRHKYPSAHKSQKCAIDFRRPKVTATELESIESANPQSRPISQQIATIIATEATFTASRKTDIEGELRIFSPADLARPQTRMKEVKIALLPRLLLVNHLVDNHS